MGAIALNALKLTARGEVSAPLHGADRGKDVWFDQEGNPLAPNGEKSNLNAKQYQGSAE